MGDFCIIIKFKDGEQLDVRVTEKEFVNLKDRIIFNSNDEDFHTFDIENSSGELSLRPYSVKYITY